MVDTMITRPFFLSNAALWLPCILLNCLFGVGCGRTNNDETLVKALSDVVKRRAAAGDMTPIRLGQITTFSWDRVFIVAPYTQYSEVEKSINITREMLEDTGIATRDDVVVLVFTKGKQVVRTVTYPRGLGDLSQVKAKNGLATSEALFVVYRDQSDDSSIVLRLDGRTVK